MEIRAKWNNMIDADKCQYNGYSDFFTRETSRRRVEEISMAKDKKESSELKRKVSLLSKK